MVAPRGTRTAEAVVLRGFAALLNHQVSVWGCRRAVVLPWWEWEECEQGYILQVYAKLGWCGSKITHSDLTLCTAILFSVILVSISCSCDTACTQMCLSCL